VLSGTQLQARFVDGLVIFGTSKRAQEIADFATPIDRIPRALRYLNFLRLLARANRPTPSSWTSYELPKLQAVNFISFHHIETD